MLSLCFAFSSYGMKKKLLSQYENLQREIFIRQFYKDYSFGLLQQIEPKDPLSHKTIKSLIIQGQQKYAALCLKQSELESFDQYSLSELERMVLN